MGGCVGAQTWACGRVDVVVYPKFLVLSLPCRRMWTCDRAYLRWLFSSCFSHILARFGTVLDRLPQKAIELLCDWHLISFFFCFAVVVFFIGYLYTLFLAVMRRRMASEMWFGTGAVDRDGERLMICFVFLV